MVLLFRTGEFTVMISIQGFNLLTIGKPRGRGYTLVQLVELVMGLLYKHMQKVQAHSDTMCSSGKIWGDVRIYIDTVC